MLYHRGFRCIQWRFAGISQIALKQIIYKMKKAYCVSTCTTCQRIMKDSDLIKKGYAYQNIKEDKISPAQLEQMKAMIGSYEALFSRRSLKYKSMGLKNKKLTENDYRDLIL